jgi:ketosteroid isomerase-like protein
MPGQNEALVRRWWERVDGGDIGEDLWHPDLVLENAEGWVLEVDYHGYEGLRRWWEDLTDVVSDPQVELEEATELEDGRVLTVQRMRGSFNKTGIEWDGPWASVITVRDGKLAHAKGYLSKRRALRALGAGG